MSARLACAAVAWLGIVGVLAGADGAAPVGRSANGTAIAEDIRVAVFTVW